MPGAMPWHHRWIGNPLLSGFLNLVFRTGASDCHCGMRAFTKDAYRRMNLQMPGMELASEMVIKAAQMGVPIVVSRSGITEMGLEVAQWVGLCAIGRATHKRFLCYSALERLELETELADGSVAVLTPGMSYQVADDTEPHRSRTEIGATLFIVD